MWNVRLPQRRHSVCDLLWRLPKLAVPLPTTCASVARQSPASQFRTTAMLHPAVLAMLMYFCHSTPPLTVCLPSRRAIRLSACSGRRAIRCHASTWSGLQVRAAGRTDSVCCNRGFAGRVGCWASRVRAPKTPAPAALCGKSPAAGARPARASIDECRGAPPALAGPASGTSPHHDTIPALIAL
jgi:hypothetical protein